MVSKWFGDEIMITESVRLSVRQRWDFHGDDFENPGKVVKEYDKEFTLSIGRHELDIKPFQVIAMLSMKKEIRAFLRKELYKQFRE